MKWFERFKFALVLCSIGSRCVIGKMKAWDKKMWRCKGDQESAHLCFARMLTSCHLFFQVSQNGSWYLCNTAMHCAVTVAEYLGNFWWESWSGSIKMMLRIPETCWLSLVLPFASCSIDIHFTVYAAFALASFLRRGSEHLMMYRARCMATSDIRRNGIRESHSEGLIIDPKSTLLCKPFECQWNSGQTNHYESPMPVRWCSGDLTATKFFKRTEVAAEAYLKLYCSVKFWSSLGCINC